MAIPYRKLKVLRPITIFDDIFAKLYANDSIFAFKQTLMMQNPKLLTYHGKTRGNKYLNIFINSILYN